MIIKEKRLRIIKNLKNITYYIDYIIKVII